MCLIDNNKVKMCSRNGRKDIVSFSKIDGSDYLIFPKPNVLSIECIH
ncbi:hypothetical protein ES703_29664 [subsurface metagenome]